jgi:hypothetical protein
VEIEFSPRVTNASLSAEKGSKVAISAVVIVAAKSWLDDFGPWREAPSADCARLDVEGHRIAKNLCESAVLGRAKLERSPDLAENR